MAIICSKCGAELNDGALFCNKCGTSVSEMEAQPVMSLEESKKLAEDLKAKFTEYEKSEHDISDMEARAKSLDKNMGGQVSGFKYFWPTLIVTPVSFFVFRWLIYILLDTEIIYGFDPEELAWIPYVLAVIVFVLGIVIAAKSTNSANANIEKERASNIERSKKMLEEVETMKKNREALGKELAEYSSIPEQYRNSASMTKVIYLLNTGKAKDFKEGVRKLILV